MPETYRMSVDTGGTFTDLVLATPERLLGLWKAPTTQHDMYVGVRDAMALAAAALGHSLAELLAATSTFVYATTRATNAVLEGETARTAFVTTAGHPDILLYKEGGRTDVHNQSLPFPEPFVPRHLTFELEERMSATGGVLVPLAPGAADAVARAVVDADVEAVAVCLLWSIVNPAHELAFRDALQRLAPDLPVSLSHEVNPIIREYRRASATALDAALKPLMQQHLREIDRRLRDDGFRGEPLMVTHLSGGVLSLEEMRGHPVHTIDSGPSLAPVAGLTAGRAAGEAADLIVLDAGGTSFEVSLTRSGTLVHTREKWLGPRWLGHMTGLPAVDVTSIGAGGGSIAFVDAAGLLHVGPRSAGAVPGPAAYGKGGTLPTVTDAAVVLGYVDPDHFLGGRMHLDAAAARDALATLAEPLGLTCEEAAEAVLRILTENMRALIVDMTMAQGIDPRGCAVVMGGGSAGFAALRIAQDLAIRRVLIPRLAAGLSAMGGQYSDLTRLVSRAAFTSTAAPDLALVNTRVGAVRAELDAFLAAHRDEGEPVRRLLCEARYVGQLWEVDVDVSDFPPTIGPAELGVLQQRFDVAHATLFSVNEPGADIELVSWRGEARLSGRKPSPELPPDQDASHRPAGSRPVFLDGGWQQVPVWPGAALEIGTSVAGPGVLEAPSTSVLVPRGARVHVDAAGFVVDVAPATEGR